MDSACIKLVSFVAESQTEAVARHLSGREIATEQICHSTFPGTRCPLALFLLDGAEPPQGLVLETIRSNTAGYRIGIFLGREPDWLRSDFHVFDDFLVWPCPDWELDSRIRRATESVPAAEARQPAQSRVVNSIVGESPEILRTIDMLRRFAACDAPVLIEGETGTGKELAARAIHYEGGRSDQPFIAVNCGAMPDDLIENELFGHERGAYTDARTNYEGLVARAGRGTLFLDEVETLTHKAQVVLLRFLQEQEYRPLGSRSTRISRARIIAASNCKLTQLVAQGGLRQDLFFRLNIMAITMPALRARAQDITLLAEHFLRTFRERYGQPHKRLTPRSLRWMQQYPWPGNVRELENLVHREFLLADGEEIAISAPEAAPASGMEAPGDASPPSGEFNIAKAEAIERFERHYLCALLAAVGGNISQAARRAGKERRALGKLLKKHGIDRTQFA